MDSFIVTGVAFNAVLHLTTIPCAILPFDYYPHAFHSNYLMFNVCYKLLLFLSECIFSYFYVFYVYSPIVSGTISGTRISFRANRVPLILISHTDHNQSSCFNNAKKAFALFFRAPCGDNLNPGKGNIPNKCVHDALHMLLFSFYVIASFKYVAAIIGVSYFVSYRCACVFCTHAV